MPDEGSAQQLARVEFATAMRGYDKDEVDTFLRELADEHNRLLTDLAAARRSAEKAHLELGEEIGELLQHAKDIADGMIKKAGEEAASIKERARRNAEKLLADANRRVDELTTAAEHAAITKVRAAQQQVSALKQTETEVRAHLTALRHTVRTVQEQIDKADARPRIEEKVLDEAGEIAVLTSPSK